MPGREVLRGYVEKKKDWIQRARDFQEKDKKIRYLRQKAKERSKDEFNYHMIKSRVRIDGVHQDIADESEEEQTEVQKLFSDVRDLQYVRHKHSLELKKIEKLKNDVLTSDVADELEKRIERARELKIVMDKLELKKRLALSRGSQLKPKLVKEGRPTRAAVYKFHYERKK